MATVNKNFRIKNGLVVEGSTGTINGQNILTETGSDTYILNLIGGETLVKSVSSDFTVTQGGELQINGSSDLARTGDIPTQTSDLTEANGVLYFTDARAREALSAGTGINYDNTTGEISADLGDFNTDNLSEGTTNKYYHKGTAEADIGAFLANASKENIAISYDPSSGLSITAENGVADSTTDDLDEGTTNKYFTNTRARDAISGVGVVSYDGSKGEISVSYNTGLTNNNGKLEIDRNTVDQWYDASGAAGDVQDNLDDHTGASSNVHGVTGSVVGTTDSQDLSNKRFIDTVYFTDGVTINNEGEIAIRSGSHDFDVQANYGDLHLKTTASGADVQITSQTGDILLNADGKAYYGSASEGNEIATHSYVDNAVSGLDWKNAVNLLANINIPSLTDFLTETIDGHTVGFSQIGYRILLTNQDTDSENGIYDVVAGSTTGLISLTRSADSDANDELKGAAVYVMEGSTYGATSWVQSNHYISNFANQDWTQFSGQGSVTAGDGITVDGLEISIDRTTVDDWYEASGAVSTHSDLTTGVHGVTGYVVGTSDSQTLTNKTISGSSNTISNIGNSSLTHSSITINGNATSLGDSVTLYTDDIDENAGATNLYFTDARAQDAVDGTDRSFTSVSINEVSKEVAATTGNIVSAAATTAYAWAKADYRSAKFMVKIKNGSHTEVCELLVTLDTSDNVYLTEYGMSSTSGTSLGTITADVSGADVRIRVTPANNNSEVIVAGTLIK